MLLHTYFFFDFFLLSSLFSNKCVSMGAEKHSRGLANETLSTNIPHTNIVSVSLLKLNQINVKVRKMFEFYRGVLIYKLVTGHWFFFMWLLLLLSLDVIWQRYFFLFQHFMLHWTLFYCLLWCAKEYFSMIVFFFIHIKYW